ncbi:MAG: hypothetical protein P4L91_17110 [Burkholderiaceae bacterium]|nr:hypothetical protein [Burkholderiaceae bacterium]
MTHKEALVVYWQLGYRDRINILIKLISAKHPDKSNEPRKTFDTLAQRLETAYTFRNIVAHSIWLPGLATNEISPFDFDIKRASFTISGKGAKRKSYKAIDFHKEAQKIDRLAEDLKYFFSTYFKVTFIHQKKDCEIS